MHRHADAPAPPETASQRDFPVPHRPVRMRRPGPSEEREVVDGKGLEPSTSALRTPRSPS